MLESRGSASISMAKGKKENMSDEEKEIDIESDEVNWVLYFYDFASCLSIVPFKNCLIIL